MVSRLVNGLVIVVLGAVLLMNTTGYLPWTVWNAAIQYWPLLLIGLGLQIALSKWQIPGLALALIAIMILGAMQPYTYRGWDRVWPRRFVPRIPTSSKTDFHKGWKVPLDGALTRLEIDLKAPSMDVEVRGDSDLNSNSEPSALVADLSWDVYEPAAESEETMGGKGLRVKIDSSAPDGSDAGKQDWVLTANPSLPVSMTATAGVANITGDCRSLNLEDLTIMAGVSKLDISLGLSGEVTRLSVSGGIANVDLSVPCAAGLKVMLSGTPFINQDFSREGLVKSGNVWMTPGYDSATSKIDLIVACATGKVALHRVEDPTP